jgi:hypothetical protein
MKKRLIELVMNTPKLPITVGGRNNGKTYQTAGNIADHLLANGVIVPPCKVGDTVYVLRDWGYKKDIQEEEVGAIVIKGTNDFSKELWEDVFGGVIGSFADFGKTVFLSKEEAEKALKGGVQE